ncbi:MAG: hypothetical protein IJ578_05840 [Bacteroidales bacterium]|nr:hypothetical protein [Bacteroidales bacterium]
MKQTLTAIVTLLLFCLPAVVKAQDDKKQPTMEELATQEADRLASLLDLEDWQLFYVDSTLQHDYVAMDAELKDLQKAKVGNTDLYVAAQDRWMEQIEKKYKEVFTEQQWAKYLKSGAARAQKARAKRQEKAAKAAANGKK